MPLILVITLNFGYGAELWPQSAADQHAGHCSLFLPTHEYTIHLFLHIFLVTPTVQDTSCTSLTAIFRAVFTQLKVACVSFRLHSGATFV